MRQGAVIDFSGGGMSYAAGSFGTTKLVSGNRIYNINSASASVQYDAILNSQTFTNAKYGVTTTFEGIYYGGAVPVQDYSPAYVVGDRAGSLALLANQVVLDGTILGKATWGQYQTVAYNSTVAGPLPLTDPDMQPAAGQLTIGNVYQTVATGTWDTADFGIASIVVAAGGSVLGSAPFDVVNGILPSGATVLSASTLTGAGLGTLKLATNGTLTVEAGASIALVPGGTFQSNRRKNRELRPNRGPWRRHQFERGNERDEPDFRR